MELGLKGEVAADIAATKAISGDRQTAKIRKYNSRVAACPYTWGLKVCDEAHVLRDPKCGTPRAVMLAKSDATVLVTATPTLNCVEDIFGIALQVWRGAGFFDFSLPEGATWEYMATEFAILDVELEIGEKKNHNTLVELRAGRRC